MLNESALAEQQKGALVLLEAGLTVYPKGQPYAELAVFLGSLRALQIIHQSHHWQSMGKNSYSDHLLYQRLYEVIEREVDAIGEKIVGTGQMKLTNYFTQLKHIENFLNVVTSRGAISQDSYTAELAIVTMGEVVINRLQIASGDKKYLTAGIEQAIGDILNKHEEHLYLLQQRNA